MSYFIGVTLARWIVRCNLLYFRGCNQETERRKPWKGARGRTGLPEAPGPTVIEEAVVAAPRGASALAPDPVAVPVEVMEVRGEDPEVPGGDVRAVQIRWRGRNADVGVGGVAGPRRWRGR